MSFDPTILNARFGLGRSPRLRLPETPEALLAALAGPDEMAARYPLTGWEALQEAARERRRLVRRRREASGAEQDRLVEEIQALTREVDRDERFRNLGLSFARAVESADPLRERLTWFWGDHFTTNRTGPLTRGAHARYVEQAIRPHMTGRFADLLRAAILHQRMVQYLDQVTSVGPNSRAAQGRPDLGLNENLARELLELHTLGVDGSYSQADVRQTAELLAGLTGYLPTGLRFDPRRGEPGPEEVLGRRYGRRAPKLADIEALLDDLARHPDTARHIARKLAVHFVSDTPDPALVDHVAARFRDTEGDLAQVYAALLEHPAAQGPELAKVKWPVLYVTSALRALGAAGDDLAALPWQDVRRMLFSGMSRMGQRWDEPRGPDGWPEEAAHWVAPPLLAARMNWTMTLTRRWKPLPEPEAFVEAALGPLADGPVRFAAGNAETRAEAVALVLLAPAFQRC